MRLCSLRLPSSARCNPALSALSAAFDPQGCARKFVTDSRPVSLTPETFWIRFEPLDGLLPSLRGCCFCLGFLPTSRRAELCQARFSLAARCASSVNNNAMRCPSRDAMRPGPSATLSISLLSLSTPPELSVSALTCSRPLSLLVALFQTNR